MERSPKNHDKFDWTLTLILLLCFIISCTAIYSAQTTGQYADNFVLRQVFWYAVGAIIISIVVLFDSEQFWKLSWYLYGFGVFLLVLLVIAPESIAPIRNGAKSWFIIPGLGSIQPSEFVKIFLILALSRAIISHTKKYQTKTIGSDFLLFFKLGIITSIPLGLIMLQPDLGTGLVIVAIFTGLILVSGITWKLIIPIYGTGIVIFSTVFYLVISNPDFLEKYLKVQPYQFRRIYAWLDPHSFQTGDGYHLINSMRAIGSGMLTGKGFNGREVYIPENHTDFIFSVIGEEYGFVGGSLVIGIFFLLIYHLIKTALETTDAYNTYICAGVICMITFHVFQNIGMTIQVLPITGIPLPFISYGGSSLMGNMLAMGLIYSIRFHHKTYMFSNSEL
ncbi:FtsW/RodA/SpoVE family cell cycle protein [Mesobacillus harenae]|uniref:FtsW/RodA/SpoVE family cell cycle protein n=1 Tax=Mesobacillus harenae TaxID=2213203 RepID=UPI0015803179|nr:FtsW/RodA/SpoVE family cell cycle protein [Mesobacillus harenae]